MGDSNTYANQSGRWAREGKGKTEAEDAICRWMRSHEEGSDNGWWLAADDQPSGRSWTAASGVTSAEYLAGGKGGLPPLDGAKGFPAGKPTLSLSKGRSNGGGLPPLADILKEHNPQIAPILLGTNDLNVELPPSEFLQNMRSIFEKCLANGTIPIAHTLPPTNWGQSDDLTAYNQELVEVAVELGIPLIDVHNAFLSRRPGDSWLGSLVSDDGAHLTHELASGPATPENLANCGHLLRCWLTVQMVAEIKLRVLDMR